MYRYRREIPRDLFNEAKLLKCLGQLALIAHNRHYNGVPIPEGLRVEYVGDWFAIDQNPSSGGLFCKTIRVYVRGKKVNVESCYNSKSPYPLAFDCGGGIGEVFNDDGSLADEFLALFK